jgi:hypothetical protein
MAGLDCAAACKVAEDIPGWLMPQEAAYLYHVGFHSQGNILELGTYYGKSTYLLAQGIRDAGKPHKVITVDVHYRGTDPHTAKPLILAEDSPLAVCRSLKTHGLEDLVIQMIGWTHVCVPLFDFRSIATVFIDAGHDYESCSKDFLAVRERLPAQQRLLLLFHDYSEHFPGVKQTIDELVRTDGRFHYLDLIHSLFVCEMAPVAAFAREGDDTPPALLRCAG